MHAPRLTEAGFGSGFGEGGGVRPGEDGDGEAVLAVELDDARLAAQVEQRAGLTGDEHVIGGEAAGEAVRADLQPEQSLQASGLAAASRQMRDKSVVMFRGVPFRKLGAVVERHI
jgi:hypothetical protein